jgi:hypothetical protein
MRRMTTAAAAAVVCLAAVHVAAPGLLPLPQGHLASAATRASRSAAAQLFSTGGPTAADTATSAEPSANALYVPTVRDSSGRPGRWNPCTTIPVVVNPEGAPPGALGTLRIAFGALDRATGLRFIITGTTTERPTLTRGLASTGAVSWPPVLIAWATPGTSGFFADNESAQTIPVWENSDGHEVYVTSETVFNAADNSLYRPGFGTAGSGMHQGALMEHELGHLAGLDESPDPAQVMYEYVDAAQQYMPGDLAGLRAVGAAHGCLSTPEP